MGIESGCSSRSCQSEDVTRYRVLEAHMQMLFFSTRGSAGEGGEGEGGREECTEGDFRKARKCSE